MPLPLIIGGLAVGKFIYDAFNQTSTASNDADFYRSQIKSLQEQLPGIKSAYSQTKELAQDEYELSVENMYNQINKKMYDITSARNQGIAKSGLAYSGSIESASQRLSSDTLRAAGINRDMLDVQYGNRIIDIEQRYGREIGAIEGQIAEYENLRKNSQAVANRFMPPKNIRNIVSRITPWKDFWED